MASMVGSSRLAAVAFLAVCCVCHLVAAQDPETTRRPDGGGETGKTFIFQHKFTEQFLREDNDLSYHARGRKCYHKKARFVMKPTRDTEGNPVHTIRNVKTRRLMVAEDMFTLKAEPHQGQPSIFRPEDARFFFKVHVDRRAITSLESVKYHGQYVTLDVSAKAHHRLVLMDRNLLHIDSPYACFFSISYYQKRGCDYYVRLQKNQTRLASMRTLAPPSPTITSTQLDDPTIDLSEFDVKHGSTLSTGGLQEDLVTTAANEPMKPQPEPEWTGKKGSQSHTTSAPPRSATEQNQGTVGDSEDLMFIKDGRKLRYTLTSPTSEPAAEATPTPEADQPFVDIFAAEYD